MAKKSGKDKAGEKTNVMRLLDQAGLAYSPHYYGGDTALSGKEVAGVLGISPERVYKTLVTRGASGGYFVFVIPVALELDLKKAARAVGEKSVAMIHVSEINKVTGYIRGGCSPVGMKKQYPTVFDRRALGLPAVIVSGGRIGTQVEAEPGALMKLVGASSADLTAEN